MTLPMFLHSLRWLIADTARLAVSSGLFAVMTAVTGLVILFCLSLGVSGDKPLEDREGRVEFLPRQERFGPMRVAMLIGLPTWSQAALSVDTLTLKPEELAARSGVSTVSGELTLLFGAIRVPLTRDRRHLVSSIQIVLAGYVADAAGVLLALVWTAGFLPSFLDPAAASVMLAKPIPRWGLLLGKYLGVLLFVLAQATLFVGGTWLALGVKTGVWEPRYLLCIPLLVTHFAVFFGFSAFIAVATRSTVASVIGSILFWLICWGMNFGRHGFLLTPEASQIGEATRFLIEAGYWILPKPADMGFLLFESMNVGDYFGTIVDIRRLQQQGGIDAFLSVGSSLLATVAVLAAAAWQFRETEY